MRGMIYVLLALMVPNARGDWAGFGQHAAMAEIRLSPGEARVSLRVLATPAARERLALPSDGADPSAYRDLLAVHAPGQREELTLVSNQHVEATATVESHDEMIWSQRLDASTQRLRIEPRSGMLRGALGLVVLDRGIPLSDLIPVGEGLDVVLDAKDPWRSRFTQKELIRRHTEPGSYLYVEPTEVRHELLLRLTDIPVDAWAHGTTRGHVPPLDRAGVKAAVGRYLSDRAPLKINGKPMQAAMSRVDFVVYDRTGMRPLSDAETLTPATALIGAVLVYLTDESTRSLELKWELFSGGKEGRRVSVVLGRETFDDTVTRTAPVFEWSHDEAMDPEIQERPDEPFATSQVPSLNPENLPGVIETLLHNTYKAFQIREEAAAYDRMAQSLQGDFLEDIYLQQRRSLLKRDRGLGGEGRVERVVVMDVTPETASSRSLIEHVKSWGGNRKTSRQGVIAAWRAIGEVSHWGHGHKRENAYRARLVLDRSDDNHWRIASMQFLDGHRLDEAVQK